MALQPTGLAAISLWLGNLNSKEAFIFHQLDGDGSMSAYIQGITGAPKQLYSVSSVTSSGNYNLSNITGDSKSFNFNSGVAVFQNPQFNYALGFNFIGKTAAVTAAWVKDGYLGFPGTSGGFLSYNFNGGDMPAYRARTQNEAAFFGEYNQFLGSGISLRDTVGNLNSYALPGNMYTFLGNAYDFSSWTKSVGGASSSGPDTYGPGKIMGTSFMNYNGISGGLRRNVTIFPTYTELGSVNYDSPYENIGGRGSIVIRNAESSPTAPHTSGIIMFSSGKSLSLVRDDATVASLFPSVKNTDAVTFSSGNHIKLDSTRTLNDADNGKTLYVQNVNLFLSIPGTLQKPFACNVVSEGTGRVSFTGYLGATVRNAYNAFKTGGQYTVCGLHYRAGSEVILYGDTV